MPIARYITYKCTKCRYKTTVLSGDVLFPRSCPKCGGDMTMVKSSQNNNVIDTIKDAIDIIFNSKNIKL